MSPVCALSKSWALCCGPRSAQSVADVEQAGSISRTTFGCVGTRACLGRLSREQDVSVGESKDESRSTFLLQRW